MQQHQYLQRVLAYDEMTFNGYPELFKQPSCIYTYWHSKHKQED